MKEIKKLSKYGAVRTCKKVADNVAMIVLTKGFSENASKTFDFIKDCQACFPDLPILETAITEKDFAVIVLRK